MTNTYPASAKQVSFLTSLLNDRTLADAADLKAALAANTLTSKVASDAIDRALKAPRIVRVAVSRAGAPTFADVDAALASLPAARYALASDTIADALTDTDTSDSILFFRVEDGKGKWAGRKFLKRLTGAPGAFNSHRMTVADSLTIARALARNPLEATQRFGEHYSRCGKCGAELTDDTSRALNLGPDCRQAFGL